MKTLPMTLAAGVVLAAAGASPASRARMAESPEPPLATMEAARTGGTEFSSAIHGLERRVSRLEAQVQSTEDRFDREIQPIRGMMLRFTNDTALATRIALSLVRESRATELSPQLLASVLLVENPWLDPDRRSFVGAVGLMQVMPFHAGDWGCTSDDLESIEVNICHGARIFASALERTDGDMDRALLRYNGCVRGTNTPNCFDYPTKVYAQAGKAQVEAWFSGGSRAGAAEGS